MVIRSVTMSSSSIDSSVGWSNNIVGDICSPDVDESVCTSSTPAIESKPIDISGEFMSANVPRVYNTTDSSNVLASGRVLSVGNGSAHEVTALEGSRASGGD